VRKAIGFLLLLILSSCIPQPQPKSNVSTDFQTIFTQKDIFLAGEDYVSDQYLVFVDRSGNKPFSDKLLNGLAQSGFKVVQPPFVLPQAIKNGSPIAAPSICGKTLALIQGPKGINPQDANTLDQALAQELSEQYSVNPSTGTDGGSVSSTAQTIQPLQGPTWRTYVNAPSDVNAKGVIVAVLDTGVTDIKLFTMSDYLNSLTGKETVNDVVDDFVGDQFNGRKAHGTGAAAIIAAQDNAVTSAALGIGIAPGANIIPIKFAASDGKGTGLSAIWGICHAVSKGARVLNLSFGSLLPSSLLKGAVQDAIAAGAVVVASAGNTRRSDHFKGPRCGLPNYPAAFSSGLELTDGLIAVGGVKLAGQPEAEPGRTAGPCDPKVQADLENRSLPLRQGVQPGYFTSLGKYVDIAAPGVGVTTYNTIPGLEEFEGTSFAAPYVSAAAALLLAKNPNLSPTDVERILKKNVSATYKCPPEACGVGFLDIGAALANPTP
jgi:membrane-anchored mycosin MYCP